MEDESSFSPTAIDAEYRRLGHTLGWRLFTCPVQNIDTASVGLITTNPGGDKFEPPMWSVEAGSAYVMERWKMHPAGQENLQRQVRRMFEIMSVRPEESLSGYFVPFRSRDWNSLPEKEASLRFANLIWREILEQAKLQTIIAFGKDMSSHLVSLLNARNGRQLRAGWGEQKIDVFRYGSGGKLIVLPHLSRFALFNRTESEKSFIEAVR